MKFETRDWNAYSWSKDFAGNGSFLGVTGEVKTTNKNQKPTLRRAEPQGINPRILLLTLSASVEDTGNTVMDWRRVGYRQAEGSNEYEGVTITGDCDETTVRVIPIIS